MGYRVHLMICRHCSRYMRELARIRAAARSLYTEAVSDRTEDLARVLKAIDEGPSSPRTP